VIFKPAPNDLLAALFDTVRAQVADSKATHPEDILTHALTAVEVVYEFVSRLPSETFRSGG
jgi:hypothetical protein